MVLHKYEIYDLILDLLLTIVKPILQIINVDRLISLRMWNPHNDISIPNHNYYASILVTLYIKLNYSKTFCLNLDSKTLKFPENVYSIYTLQKGSSHLKKTVSISKGQPE